MDCFICLDTDDTVTGSSCCKGMFHEKCLTQWYKQNHTCPYCRHVLVPNPHYDEPDPYWSERHPMLVQNYLPSMFDVSVARRFPGGYLIQTHELTSNTQLPDHQTLISPVAGSVREQPIGASEITSGTHTQPNDAFVDRMPRLEIKCPFRSIPTDGMEYYRRVYEIMMELFTQTDDMDSSSLQRDEETIQPPHYPVDEVTTSDPSISNAVVLHTPQSTRISDIPTHDTVVAEMHNSPAFLTLQAIVSTQPGVKLRLYKGHVRRRNYVESVVSELRTQALSEYASIPLGFLW